MTGPLHIPVTADDVSEYDFDATASPPPGSGRRGLHAGADEYGDPGHLLAEDEWAQVVARAEGRQP